LQSQAILGVLLAKITTNSFALLLERKLLAERTRPQLRKPLACSRLSLLHLAQPQFRHARFRTGHADFRAARENVSTLPRSTGGNHFETL
jgi:hypothetical protein